MVVQFLEKCYKIEKYNSNLMIFKTINPESFAKVSKEFQKIIENKLTNSILSIVYHKGELVYCNKFGWKDEENKIPIEYDDIFRFYSMTKPIVCLAALILYEQGKFNLEDPIEDILPEFKNVKVLKSYDQKTGNYELIEPKNKITLKHLFTHTSGISYGFYPGAPVDKFFEKEFGYKDENRVKEVIEKLHDFDIVENFSKRLATLPLFFEPGKHWWYGYNHEILGVIIEKLSGKKLDVFLKEHIFDKLGMVDTDFYVPEKKSKRLAKVYMNKGRGDIVEVKGVISDGFNSKPPRFLSGGGGLLSTLGDYLKFCIMMLNGGKYNGKQIVSNETIALMTTNQLTDGKSKLEMNYYKIEDPDEIERNEGFGFGLGVLVRIDENISRGGIGEYGWGGAADTTFTIDPVNQLISITLSQHIPPDNNWIQPILGSDTEIRNLVYEILGL